MSVSRYLAALAAVLLSACVHGQCRYEVVVIRVPIDNPRPQSINSHGQIVGTISGDPAAWYWTEATGTVLLPVPPGTAQAAAYDMNDDLGADGVGTIAGAIADSETWSAFVLDDDGLRLLGAIPPGVAATGLAVNGSGWVVGYSWWHAGLEAALWIGDSGIHLPGLLADNRAWDIDDAGRIVGDMDGTDRSFVWAMGVVTEIALPADATQISARAMNDQLQVVGLAIVEGHARAFIWSDGDTDLLESPGEYEKTWAWDINNAGTIVGYAESSDDGELVGVVWRNGVHFELNDFVDPNAGVKVRRTYAVSDEGQIASQGLITASGEVVVLRLTPIGDSSPDIDGDGVVGEYELEMVLSDWGVGRSPSDLNCDGIVDARDLAAVLGGWSQ